ncbi:hypothetical protein Bpfe_019279 [Biomphalaria pfeifferi]|uniref:Uncharacterized protein n=1 Tax=Biomphalaria pfeifferi TaxID=112525 RepID=A0AAD8F5F0_BIOPF|nr:hypothetical protein Bpfe_019279 [Biomphalaria pfeifferi]
MASHPNKPIQDGIVSKQTYPRWHCIQTNLSKKKKISVLSSNLKERYRGCHGVSNNAIQDVVESKTTLSRISSSPEFKPKKNNPPNFFIDRILLSGQQEHAPSALHGTRSTPLHLFMEPANTSRTRRTCKDEFISLLNSVPDKMCLRQW